MTKNKEKNKEKKTTNLPFFVTVEKGDSLFTIISFLKNFFKSVLFSNYRIRAKNSITTNCKQLNNIQFIIALFPFVVSFSLLIRSRYKDQVFSYLVKDNLPGFCLPHQNLSWETFREITSPQIAYLSDNNSYKVLPNPSNNEINEISADSINYNADCAKQVFFDFFDDDSDSDIKTYNDKNDVFESESRAPNREKYLSVEILEDNIDNIPLLESDFSTSFSNSFVSIKDTTDTTESEEDTTESEEDTTESEEDTTESEEKQTNLQDYDLIERLDIYSNLILLEMKPAWEQKQKQSYIGILPNKVTLNKLPGFSNNEIPSFIEKTFDGKIATQPKPINDTVKIEEFNKFNSKASYFNSKDDAYEDLSVIIDNMSDSETIIKNLLSTTSVSNFGSTKKQIFLQTKNNKNINSIIFSKYKFYARKPHFFSLYKNKIDLKLPLINKKPNLISIFSKQLFQQKLFDLDELPLKLDQISLEVKEETSDLTKTDISSFLLEKSITVNPPFDSLDSSKTDNQTEEMLEGYQSEDSSKTDNQTEEMLEGYQSEDSSKTDNQTEEMLEGYQSEDSSKTDNQTEEMLEGYQSDLKEETFSKNFFILNELNEFFYNEGLFLFSNELFYNEFKEASPFISKDISKDTPDVRSKYPSYSSYLINPSPTGKSVPSYLFFKNLQKSTNQFSFLSLPYSFTKIGSDKFANFIASFSNEEKNINDVNENEEKNINDVNEFSFFDYIQTLILNLEKTQINLTLPEHIIHLRPLSGYKYPDMEIAKLRTLFIENVCISIIFPHKQRYKSLPIQIEVPSSFVDDLANEIHKAFLLNENRSTSNFVSKMEIVNAQGYSFLTNEGIQQLNFHYLPASQTVFNQNLIEKSSLVYQRVETIYKKRYENNCHENILIFDRTIKNPFNTTSNNLKPVNNLLLNLRSFLYSRPPFRESWEPVTSHSWLVITKLIFIFSAANFAKKFFLTYAKDIGFFRYLPEHLKEKLGLIDEKKDKGYRLIKKVKKRFKDVVGIDSILPELSELVWFLRYSKVYGRTFKFGNSLPKGFLFVGPPGTGKTVLVQAIAGEAAVPVLVQSGSALNKSNEKEKGAQRLIKLFEQARKIAPCIVFIDEIDTLGESRQDIMRTSVGTNTHYNLIQSLHNFNQGSFKSSLVEGEGLKDTSSLLNTKRDLKTKEGDKQKSQIKQQTNQEQLNLLMQFLVELDGLKSRAGVIVIGATNRPKVLDPALTRPGRFERVLNLEIPGKTKRIEILKFYSQNIGLTLSSIATKEQIETKINKSLQSKIGTLLINENKQTNQEKKTDLKEKNTITNNLKEKKPNKETDTKEKVKSKNIEFIKRDFRIGIWEYLANRTFGFSTAALATAMNESSLKAILQDTGHTIETIDQGIEVITSYSIKKPKIDNEKAREVRKDTTTSLNNDPFLITRFAYYQAGKAVLHTLLPQHPDALFLKLWPQPKNSRYKSHSLLLTSNNNRAKLETRLIGLYAGKAAELLALSLHSHIKEGTGSYLLSGERNTNKKKKNYNVNALPDILTSPKAIREGDVRSKSYGLNAKKTFRAKHLLRTIPHKQTKKFSFSNPNNFTNEEFSPRRGEETKTRFLVQLRIKNKVFVSNLSQNDKRICNILSHSNLGLEDQNDASNLAHSLVEKWHFYSNKIAIRRENQIFNNQNQFETSEIKVFSLFQQLTEDLQNRIKASNISESHIGEQRDKYSRFNFQERAIRPWWQDQIIKQTENLNMFYDDWYRFYLPDPEESERNLEWVKPDEYYHNNPSLKNLLTKTAVLNSMRSQAAHTARAAYPYFVLRQMSIKTTDKCQLKSTLNFDITWNDLYKIDRDYIYHALILTCFNKAFSLLDENRELLDYLADYLMRFETLRQHKIKEIFYDFGSPKLENKS